MDILLPLFITPLDVLDNTPLAMKLLLRAMTRASSATNRLGIRARMMIFTNNRSLTKQLQAAGHSATHTEPEPYNPPWLPYGSLALLPKFSTPGERTLCINPRNPLLESTTIERFISTNSGTTKGIACSVAPPKDHPCQCFVFLSLVHSCLIPSPSKDSNSLSVMTSVQLEPPYNLSIQIYDTGSDAKIHGSLTSFKNGIIRFSIKSPMQLSGQKLAVSVYSIKRHAGAYDKRRPYVPQKASWKLDEKSNRMIDLKTGTAIHGRQLFPSVFEADGSLCLIGSNTPRTLDKHCLSQIQLVPVPLEAEHSLLIENEVDLIRYEILSKGEQ